MRHRHILAVAMVVATNGACALGPDYTRPRITVPTAFRDAAAPTSSELKSLADVDWFDLFDDDALAGLVRSALSENFDLRMAAERVLQARLRIHVARADEFPAIGAAAAASENRASEVGARPLPPGFGPEISDFQGGFTFGWEIDVWGRIRRLNEAARAQYVATDSARRAIVTTLIADVTDAYFLLQTMDRQIAIARRTRAVAADGLRLTQLRRDQGVASALDTRQAEQLLYTATAQIAAIERQITLTEDALSFLTGRAPGAVLRSDRFTQLFDARPAVPTGLPSSLLERRPDIRQAEQSLIAANALIGVARAEYFPRIALTGLLGVESRDLTDILRGPAVVGGIAGAAAAPIFNAGKTRAVVRVTESVQRELVVNYQRSIYAALREVADALASYRKTGEQRLQQDQLVAALRDAARLSTDRYQGGLDSYLQVLDAQRNLFRSELDLVALQHQELASLVELYRALGGGWNASDPLPKRNGDADRGPAPR